MKNTHLTFVLVLSFALSFLVNTILLVNSWTRRGADEIVKINQAETTKVSEQLRLEKDCLASNGRPMHNDYGDYFGCKK